MTEDNGTIDIGAGMAWGPWRRRWLADSLALRAVRLRFCAASLVRPEPDE